MFRQELYQFGWWPGTCPVQIIVFSIFQSSFCSFHCPSPELVVILKISEQSQKPQKIRSALSEVLKPDLNKQLKSSSTR